MIARPVPRHVGQIPLVPRERRPVGRPRRIPRVVGVRDAHRPRRPVERHDRDVARVVALDRERDLAARRDGGRDRVARRGAAPGARRAVGARSRASRPSRGDDHQLVVARPSTSRRRAAHSAVTTIGGAEPSAAATTRSERPSKLSTQARRFPDGDQRGSATPCERAISAAVIGAVTAANASRAMPVAAPVQPATRLDPGRQLASGRPALHPGLFMPNRPVPLPRPGDPLRIAFLIYRGNPHCGGQGVYSRHLTRELTELGHSRDDVRRASRGRSPTTRCVLEEVAGPRPLPPREPVPGAVALRVPHLRRPRRSSGSCARAGFPEPYAFSRRVYKVLRDRRDEFDLVHDNQCLGTRAARVHPRRLAVRQHAAPPDHRRPRSRSRAASGP